MSGNGHNGRAAPASALVALEWLLVVPNRGGMKWHVWHRAELASICGHCDRRQQEIIEPPKAHRFDVCQECRAYAVRNAIALPPWAWKSITKRKSETP